MSTQREYGGVRQVPTAPPRRVNRCRLALVRAVASLAAGLGMPLCGASDIPPATGGGIAVLVIILALGLVVSWQAWLLHQSARRSRKATEGRISRAQGDALLLRMGLRAAHMGTWEWDIPGGVMVWSEGVESLFGLQPGAFSGTFDSFISCIYPEDRAKASAAIAQSVAAGTRLSIEHRVQLSNGSLRWLRGEGELIRGPAGEPVRMMGVVMDITEQKQAQERLQANDQRNRSVIEALHEGIILYATNGTIEADNRRAEVILGVDADKLIGRSITQTLGQVIQEDGQPFRDEELPALQVMKSGRPRFNVVLGIGQGSRELSWLSCNALPLPGEHAGGTGGVVLSFVDITQRRRSDRALHESEERLRALAENVPGFILMADRTGTILYINHITAGFQREQVLGTNLRAYIRPEFHEAYFGAFERVFSHGEIGNLELQGDGAEGSSAWYFTRMGPIRNDGRIFAAVIASIDITSRKQAEDDRRAFELERDRLLERLQMQMDRMPIGCLLNDKDGLITYVNPAAERIFGHRMDEMVGRHPNEIYIPVHDREHAAALFSRLALGDMGVAGFSENITKEGGTISCEWHHTPLFNAGGRFIGIMSMVQDVTERKLLEEQFRQSQKMEAIGKLAGGIAHDFNNLLTAIMGYSELLLGASPGDSTTHAHALQIKKATQRAASLTHQLLAYSRKQVLQPRVINLNDVVRDMNGLLLRVIGEHIELVTDLEPQLWLVQADPNRIEQVLMNLAVNSRDAMPNGGTLTISTCNRVLDDAKQRSYVDLRPGDFVEVKVTDSGHGMEEAVRCRIFEPFFTTKKMGEGTGLGLSMVFGVVKQSEGHISVSSRPGVGTTFEILLPRCRGGETDKARRGTEANLEARGDATILLVEDDADVRALVSETLTAKGYHVLEAGDGEAALALSANYPKEIQLLITDVIMPRLGGRELADRLGRMRPLLRIIFMSGYADDALQGALGNRSGLAFLEKPFTSARLIGLVQRILTPPAA